MTDHRHNRLIGGGARERCHIFIGFSFAASGEIALCVGDCVLVCVYHAA